MKNFEIYHQSVFDVWPLEDNSIQAIITSPPYWGLRKYDIPDIIIGGDINCEHELIEHFTSPKGGKSHPDRPSNVGANRIMSDMDIRGVGIKSNFCMLCSAWKGQYGLEPSYKDYITHTILWAKEAWRVLKDDGVFFLNIGDSYNGSGGCGSEKYAMEKHMQFGKKTPIGNYQPPNKDYSMKSKCKMLIPHRIAISLIDEGWILRNDILWYKTNAMPESCQDRFSKKFEYIFMFVKNPKYYFNLDAVKIESKTYLTDKRCSALERARMKGYNTKIQYNGKSERISEFMASQPYCNPGDVWQINTQPSSEKHYAMWPEKLVERMLLCSTKENDIILDPFAGSGTTLKVAVQNRRKAVGIDLGYSDIQERKLKDIQIKML